MEYSRLPRFERAVIRAPLDVTARDREIIRLVHKHRFVHSGHIAALLGGSQQQLLRRLQLLYHHGYLERPRAQLDYYHQAGSRRIVYGVGDKGAALENFGPRTQRIRWSETNRSIGRIYLEHALSVSEVMIALELACRATDGIRLLTDAELLISTERPTWRWNVRVKNRVNLGVIPDRVFALEYQGTTGTKTRNYFFLEADRGTMPVIRRNLSQTSIYRKLLAYEATWSQSIHRSRFGFHRFRVLTITSSPARLESIAAACSKLERGHGLFVFGTRELLMKPKSLFSPVWRTGRPGEFTSLLS